MKQLFCATLIVCLSAISNSGNAPVIHPPETRKQAYDLMIEADQDFQNTLQLHAKLMSDASKLLQLAEDASKAAQTAAAQIGAGIAGGASQAQLMVATKQMQETQMSFNLQYLQLQNSMQNENRQYTTVSNVLKTKHDIVKNSISNIR